MLRAVQLKDLPPLAEDQPKLKTSDLINTILKTPRKEGETLSTLRAIDKIIDPLKKGGDKLLLTEDLWIFLKNRVETANWAFYHESFVKFSENIINSPLCDSNEGQTA